ncbi:tetratricopeptide repeat protein [Buchnera aphidicola (Kurisakia onigurumii)]|uniref:tetratricopeptide repeat protein n=1 Tax=Buchnera aphidicola TaxID=9 RepID=UPI0031B67F40
MKKKKSCIMVFIILFFIIIIIFFNKNHENTISTQNIIFYNKIYCIKNNISFKKLKNDENIFFNKLKKTYLKKKNDNINTFFSYLKLCNYYIAHKKLKKSIILLKNQLIYVKDNFLKNLLLIKISEIQIENKELNNSLNTLEKISDQNFQKYIYNIKGDIFLILGKQEKAIKFWKMSLQLEKEKLSQDILKIKIAYF